jgi:DNA (cytosine-5)-methyltransferase 1
MKIKVGSLFDGIGGAPLSAVLSGAEPVWASEIEKIPISITKRHFPNMKHYGDITQINGAEIEPVDIIVGGSPCQDLSVAGKRAGLAGERSGLFMDQVRIVKEMRNATSKQTGNGSDKLPRPRYMVWENVPGAFSSNKGEDFRAVLEETARVADPTISIPRSVNGWANAGSILADRFSISWRTVDAQYWGVPQRRRRIYLVADFGGHTAPEICFESESLPGDIKEGGETGQRVATDAERGVGAAGELVLNDQGGSVMSVSYGVTGTLRAQEHGHQPIVCYGFEPGIAKREGNPNRFSEDLCPTLRAKMGDNQAAVAYSLQGNMIGRADHNGPQGSGVNEDVSFTLNTVDRHAVCYGLASKGNGEAFLMEEKHMSLSCGGGQAGQGYPAILERRTDDAVCYDGSSVTSPTNRQNPKPGDPCHTLGTDSRNYVCYGVDTYNQGALIETASTLRSASGGDSKAVVCYGISSYHSNSMKSSNPHSGVYVAETSRTLDQNGGNPACNQGGIMVCEAKKEPTLNAVCSSVGGFMQAEIERSPTLMARDYKDPHVVSQQNKHVRRLTPLECERLQGYPDGWTALDYEGKAVSDTQRYKALGNSFAVPNAFFVISRCVKQLQD